MCPTQCWTNGINITETTKYQSKAPYESTHTFQVKYTFDEEGGIITIHFQLSGVTS